MKLGKPIACHAPLNVNIPPVPGRARQYYSPKTTRISQSPATRAEREALRLKRELQRMDLDGPVQRREPLPEVRHGGKVIDIERLRRGKDRGGER